MEQKRMITLAWLVGIIMLFYLFLARLISFTEFVLAICAIHTPFVIWHAIKGRKTTVG